MQSERERCEEMKVSVTGGQMKQIDRDTIGRIGIPSMVLMERAALAVADAVEQLADAKESGRRTARVLVACGTGNNGADGIAAGRLLHLRGYDVTVLLAGNPEHASEEHRSQQIIAENLGVPVVEYQDFIPGSCDIIVDAVLGIGLERNVEGQYRELLLMLRAGKDRKVVAVDIPSGIHADTGHVMGTALQADVTVTFGYRKTGMLLYPGRTYAGRVQVADIGFSDVSLQETGWDALVLEQEDLKRLPARQADSNKGTYGKLLLVAGSRGMSGAAYLGALAAYRTGAGLVKILTVEENRAILQGQIPEAIVETYQREEAEESSSAFTDFMEQQCSWADAIVLGPGLSREPYAGNLVETILAHAYVPIVIDADGLNLIAGCPELSAYYTENIIITPHIGEMARLTKKTVSDIKESPAAAAAEYAGRYGVTCVLKDAATVIAGRDGEIYLNTSGNSGMAKAGSGDVLAGVIGGLLAQGAEPVDAASLGVYLHGLAGDRAAKMLGKRSILAHEIADNLAGVLAALP